MDLTITPTTAGRWADLADLSGRGVFTGRVPMFAAAGFTEVARRADRPIHRLTFDQPARRGTGAAVRAGRSG